MEQDSLGTVSLSRPVLLIMFAFASEPTPGASGTFAWMCGQHAGADGNDTVSASESPPVEQMITEIK